MPTGFTPTEDRLSSAAMKVHERVGNAPLGLPELSTRGAAVALMCDTGTDRPAYYVTNGRMGSFTGIRLGRDYAESIATLRALWNSAEATT